MTASIRFVCSCLSSRKVQCPKVLFAVTDILRRPAKCPVGRLRSEQESADSCLSRLASILHLIYVPGTSVFSHPFFHTMHKFALFSFLCASHIFPPHCTMHLFSLALEHGLAASAPAQHPCFHLLQISDVCVWSFCFATLWISSC